LACKDLSSFGCRSIVPHQNQYQPSNGIFFHNKSTPANRKRHVT
jgi:hypothetical protein